ncbi:hypothetical protein ACQ4M4_22475 [Leptolyngbya sp. AN02str]
MQYTLGTKSILGYKKVGWFLPIGTGDRQPNPATPILYNACA